MLEKTQLRERRPLEHNDPSSASTGKATAGRGRILVVSAIVLIVILILLILFLQHALLKQSPARDGAWVGWAALLLCCVHLYRGSNWARWVLGVSLAWIGLMCSYETFSWLLVEWTWRFFLLAVPAALTLASAGTLMFSKSVREYLTLQRNRSGTLGSRVLKAAWIILLASLAFVVYLDIVRAI